MERKSIIKALESKFKCKAKYLGAPSFAYEIETEKGIFRIDRVGNIQTETGQNISLELVLTDSLEKESSIEIVAPEETSFSVSFPISYHTPRSIKVMINMIASKQNLIMKSFELTDRLLEDRFIEMINSCDISDMAEFESLINSTAPEDHNIVSFKFDEFALMFHLTKPDLSQEEMDAFFDLITLIHEASLRQQYASEKSKEVVNEKYSFRVWLLRLGMIGDSYRVSRATLLKRLEGNSAFRQPKQPLEVK